MLTEKGNRRLVVAGLFLAISLGVVFPLGIISAANTGNVSNPFPHPQTLSEFRNLYPDFNPPALDAPVTIPTLPPVLSGGGTTATTTSLPPPPVVVSSSTPPTSSLSMTSGAVFESGTLQVTTDNSKLCPHSSDSSGTMCIQGTLGHSTINTAGLVKVGTGALVLLNQPATYSGATAVNGGTFNLAGGAGTLTIANNATLNSGSTLCVANPNLFGSSTAEFGTISGGILKVGSGVLQVATNPVSDTGTTTIQGGSTCLTSDSITVGTLTIGSGGVVGIDTLPSNPTAGGHESGTLTISQPINSGTGNIPPGINQLVTPSPGNSWMGFETVAGTWNAGCVVTINALPGGPTADGGCINGGHLQISPTSANTLSESTPLESTSISVGTLTIGAGSVVAINALPGGPLPAGGLQVVGALVGVPEPSTLLLLLASAMIFPVFTWRQCRKNA